MKKRALIIFWTIFHTVVFSQVDTLQLYINEALESNLALKEKKSSYEKSILALKEAKGMFFPDVSLNARYTVAEGGREIPVGEMINPVYQSLNVLNQINGVIDPATGQPVYFPTDEIGSFPFLRPQEHETKIKVVQPILNTEIIYNKKIKSNLVEVEKADMKAYMRQLIYEVKSAYYMYWQSVEVMHLIGETEILIDENIRVNRKLFDNGLITADNIYRAESEKGKLIQKKAEALKNNRMAKAWFNFLLNKELNSEINKSESVLQFNIIAFNLDEAISNSLKKRDELEQLNYYQKANQNLTKMYKSNVIPDVSGVVDYGFQGEEYHFTNDYDFVMASVVLQWDLFKGLQNKRKIEQAKVDENLIYTKKMEAEKQINLQVMEVYYDLEATLEEIRATKLVTRSSSKAFDLIDKKYQLGQLPIIEYIDARNNFTMAKQNEIIAKYNYLKKLAEFEWVACLFPIEN